MNKVKSNWQESSCGAPHRSSLGPHFYLIYMKELPKATNSSVKLFVVDAILSLSDKNSTDLGLTTNEEFKKIENLMKINRLTINHKKKNYMIITKKKVNESPFNIKIGQNEITNQKWVKYLGVMIDNRLKWKNHVHHVNAKL